MMDQLLDACGTNGEGTVEIIKNVTLPKSLTSFRYARDSKHQQSYDPSTKQAEGQLDNIPVPFELQAHPFGKHKEAHEETEKKFPKLRFRLSEMQMMPVHEYKPKDTESLQREERSLQHDRYLRTLRTMYQVSLSNMASARRLLEKNSLFADFEDGNSVHNLVAYLFPEEHKTQRAPKMRQFTQGSEGHASEQIQEKPEQMVCESEKPIENLITKKDKICECGPLEAMVSVPLTMEEVVMKNPIMEAKRASSNWTNYAKKEHGACYRSIQSTDDEQPLQGSH